MKCFTQVSRAWYAKTAFEPSVVEEIIVQDREADLEEFILRWYDFDPGRESASPQLGMFYTAWGWFAHEPAIFEWLKANAGRPVRPAQVVALLENLGYEDATEESGPTGTAKGPRPVGKAPPEMGRS